MGPSVVGDVDLEVGVIVRVDVPKSLDPKIPKSQGLWGNERMSRHIVSVDHIDILRYSMLCFALYDSRQCGPCATLLEYEVQKLCYNLDQESCLTDGHLDEISSRPR